MRTSAVWENAPSSMALLYTMQGKRPRDGRRRRRKKGGGGGGTLPLQEYFYYRMGSRSIHFGQHFGQHFRQKKVSIFLCRPQTLSPDPETGGCPRVLVLGVGSICRRYSVHNDFSEGLCTDCSIVSWRGDACGESSSNQINWTLSVCCFRNEKKHVS